MDVKAIIMWQVPIYPNIPSGRCTEVRISLYFFIEDLEALFLGKSALHLDPFLSFLQNKQTMHSNKVRTFIWGIDKGRRGAICYMPES